MDDTENIRCMQNSIFNSERNEPVSCDIWNFYFENLKSSFSKPSVSFKLVFDNKQVKTFEVFVNSYISQNLPKFAR